MAETVCSKILEEILPEKRDELDFCWIRLPSALRTKFRLQKSRNIKESAIGALYNSFSNCGANDSGILQKLLKQTILAMKAVHKLFYCLSSSVYAWVRTRLAHTILGRSPAPRARAQQVVRNTLRRANIHFHGKDAELPNTSCFFVPQVFQSVFCERSRRQQNSEINPKEFLWVFTFSEESRSFPIPVFATYLSK